MVKWCGGWVGPICVWVGCGGRLYWATHLSVWLVRLGCHSPAGTSENAPGFLRELGREEDASLGGPVTRTDRGPWYRGAVLPASRVPQPRPQNLRSTRLRRTLRATSNTEQGRSTTTPKENALHTTRTPPRTIHPLVHRVEVTRMNPYPGRAFSDIKLIRRGLTTHKTS